jgi:hypothetical protein
MSAATASPLFLKPLVSIVIPVFNGSDFLSQAIDSALRQTYPNVEVLVINDGSTDQGKTEQIATKFGKRIRYFSKPNGGVSSALNLGLQEMKGSFFSWLSHDDTFFPEKTERQMDIFRQRGRQVVLYSDHDYIDSNSRKIGNMRFPHVEPDDFLFSILTKHLVNGCTTLIPRECFEEVGFFDESLKTTQDYDMWFRLGQRFPFIHLPEILVHSRLHPNQGCLVIPTHAREIDQLHVRFLRAIPRNLLERSQEGKNTVQGYLSLGLALKKMGCNLAAHLAMKQAFERRGVDESRCFSDYFVLFYTKIWHRFISASFYQGKLKGFLRKIGWQIPIA